MRATASYFDVASTPKDHTKNKTPSLIKVPFSRGFSRFGASVSTGMESLRNVAILVIRTPNLSTHHYARLWPNERYG